MPTKGCRHIHPESDLRCVLEHGHSPFELPPGTDPKKVGPWQAADGHVFDLELVHLVAIGAGVLADWALTSLLDFTRCPCGLRVRYSTFPSPWCRCGRRLVVEYDVGTIAARVDELAKSVDPDRIAGALRDMLAKAAGR